MRQVPVRWGMSRHARRLLTLALAALVAALITRRAEFAGAAAPAVLLLAARRPARPDRVGAQARLTSGRLVEDEEAAVLAELDGLGGYRPEFRLAAADGVTSLAPAALAAGGAAAAGGADGAAGEHGAAARLPFRVSRWGRRPAGTVEIVLRDRLRLAEGRISLPLPQVEVAPRPARMERTVVLRRLPSLLGEHASRQPGEGIEFAGVREFVPGDRQRRINWPATTRRGSLQLNTFTAERAQNVVVIADIAAEAGEPGSSSADLAVRAAAGLARTCLAARDRVGLVLFAGVLAWLPPGTGERQFRRITDVLILGPDALGQPAQVSRERRALLDRLPRAALPPGALIAVFSALLDQRLVAALRDLRERGFTVLVVDVLNVEPDRRGPIAALAWRMWRLEQEAIRFSLRQLGIPVAHWDGGEPLDTVLAAYTRRPAGARR